MLVLVSVGTHLFGATYGDPREINRVIYGTHVVTVDLGPDSAERRTEKCLDANGPPEAVIVPYSPKRMQFRYLAPTPDAVREVDWSLSRDRWLSRGNEDSVGV